jgi:hypothetical protein
MKIPVLSAVIALSVFVPTTVLAQGFDRAALRSATDQARNSFLPAGGSAIKTITRG